jgi:hypothetical protein
MAKTERLKAKMKEQRKISLEECCETHLRNPIFKDGMANLLLLFRELKMKPSWYHSNSYKCHYKKEAVAYITVYNDNCFIKVATVSAADNVCRNNVSDFVRTLNDEMKAEFVSHFKPCSNYAETKHSCAPFCDVEVNGAVHKSVCKHTKVYNIKNPTEEQFKWVEKFIMARREYIKNVTNKHNAVQG